MAPPLRVEPECPLDEETEWIVGRSTESVGLMYFADADSWTHRLADLQTRKLVPKIFTAEILCSLPTCTLQRMSPRIRESAEYIRPNRLASLYLELHLISVS